MGDVIDFQTRSRAPLVTPGERIVLQRVSDVMRDAVRDLDHEGSSWAWVFAESRRELLKMLEPSGQSRSITSSVPV
jgi:hypothetical protein